MQCAAVGNVRAKSLSDNPSITPILTFPLRGGRDLSDRRLVVSCAEQGVYVVARHVIGLGILLPARHASYAGDHQALQCVHFPG